MEFTNILGKIKSSEKKEKESFFALEICSDTVKSAVWEVADGKPEVVKIGTVEEWEEKKESSFLSAVDRTISSASAGVTPEPNSIIFGLPEEWVKKDQISKNKKKILKEVCEKLELKPLGFVVTLEALVTFLRKRQGTPPSAIFIRLAETEIFVSVVSLGKVLGSKTVVRSEDLAADVKEGLARFEKIENFPPRMILFDSYADFEEAKQQLISYEWEKDLPFLHFPKVESLAVETSIRAIAVAGGSEVAKSLGIEIKEEEGEKKVSEAPKVSKEEEETVGAGFVPARIKDESGVAEETSDKKEDKHGKEGEEDATEELRFVVGGDVLKKGKEVDKVKKVISKEDKTNGKEGSAKAPKITKALKVKDEDSASQQTQRFSVAEKVSEAEKGPQFKTQGQRPVFKKKFAFVNNLFILVKKVKNKLFARGLSLPEPRRLKLLFSGFPAILTLIIFVFIGLIIGGFFIYWRVPKAKVTIFIKPEVLEKEVSLTVSAKETFLDKEKKIIPGEMQVMEVNGKETISTTGKKLVGDKASGEVIIFNKTDSAKTFEAGTVLVGPDSLRFELADDVEIASQSAQTEGITYGKTNVKIEAASIGPEYNVESGTEFNFKDFGTGSFSAKAEAGLSGGTSREIKAVSEEDQEVLLAKLTEKLEAQATQELEEKLPSGMKVFEKGLKSRVKSKKFNHDIDDEADKLSLDLSLKTSALSFAKEDLDTLLFHVLADQIPENFELRPTDLSTEIKDIKIEDQKAEFEVLVKAELLPRYDMDKLVEDLVGKYPEIANETLSSLPNFAKATIEITPKLPGKLGTLPRLKQNIEIEVRIAD